MHSIDPYTPSGVFIYECRTCNARIESDDRIEECTTCGGAVQNLAVPRE